ncbi:MAG: FecR domain-containing protein [Deltaproteobacteria bacterium]|nr:FecR domain-containing protein [Deltaproteobacteria bacterium]
MKRNQNLDAEQFDRAVLDAFLDDTDCGAFGTIDTLSKRRDVNDILMLASEKESATATLTASSKHSSGLIGFSSAAAIVIAALTAIFVWYTSNKSTESSSEEHPTTWFGEVQNLGGTLYLGNQPAVPNAPLPVEKTIRIDEGTAMLRLPTGIAWHMEQNTHGEIHSIKDNRLEVTVHQGESWFNVDPQRMGPAFSVQTPMGSIDVTGTIFVVNAKEDDTTVTLLKGEVWITLESGRRMRLKAGNLVHLRKQSQSELSKQESADYHKRLVALKWAKETSLDVADNTEASSAMNGSAEKNGVAHLNGAASVLTQSQLLRDIRSQRQQHNWGKVADLYQRLIRNAPRSETAIVSRVSLGEVYLTKLNRFGDALTHFNKYLKSGHTALLPEASIGKCRALRGMGKHEKEMKCLENFIATYPSAFQTPDAKTRLDKLTR